MKVGILSQFGERQLTGVPRVVEGIVRELKRIESSNEYYYLGREPFLPEKLENIDILYTNKEGFLLDLAVMSRNINIVHSFYYAYKLSDRHCKKIITIHDLMHYIHPEWFYESTNAYFRGPLKEMAQTADKIIADSLATKNDIIKCYEIDENKVSVVYPGLYPREIYDGDGIAPQITGLEEENYILSVAAIHEYKNQRGLIKAFDIFKGRHPEVDLKLVLVGGIRKEMYLNDLIQQCASKDDIILTGYLNDKELVWLYKNAFLFAYISLYEGFGLPILEALDCGRPVVCSNVTSMPEVGGDAVCYCNPYEIDSVATAFEEVVFDEEMRKELISRAKIQAKKFSYEKAAREILKIYEKIGKTE